MCCGAGVFLVPYIHIPHPPFLIMRGGGGGEGEREQQEQQKINTGLINPINSSAARPGDKFYDFVDAHTHTEQEQSTERKTGTGDTMSFLK